MNLFVNKQFVPERKIFFFAVLLAAVLIFSGTFYPPNSMAAKSDTTFLPPDSFASLAESASPAVVNIRTVKTILIVFLTRTKKGILNSEALDRVLSSTRTVISSPIIML